MVQMHFIKTAIVVGFVGLTTLLSFQNCSPVKFYDLAEEARLTALEIERIGAAEETVTAGINEVPELKMVFVVDNSGTMIQNQLNLADSFSSMFDSSSSSLNRFDSTTFLINTSQTLPVYINASEKNSYDSISTLQSSFNINSTQSKVNLDTLYRKVLPNLEVENTGAIPGDNLGFSLKKSANPLAYEILPAPVVGSIENSGQITFTDKIRMPANSNIAQIESEFKNRLAVMDSRRIPQQLINSVYLPQHSSIVDYESGLCSVARILRNPANFFQPGELVSFTLVSDENDNNPSGDRCVQSVKEFTGNEDLIDLDCKKNSTTISYRAPNTTVVPDKCSTNGQVGYNFKFTYNKPNVEKTTVEYLWLESNAKYTANFYNLKYKKLDSVSYKYLYTKVLYRLEECFDVFSDGTKTGTRCSPKATFEPAQYVLGNQVSNCLAVARTFNVNALSTAGFAPQCSTEDRTISTCNVADPLCKATESFSEIQAVGSPFAGNLPSASACTTQAQGFSDYRKEALCEPANKTNLDTCSGQPVAANCFESSPRITKYKKETPTGDIRGSDNCVTWAKGRSGNQVNTSADIKTCSFAVTSGGTAEVSNSINFLKNGVQIDGGTTLANGDCGVIKSAAYDIVKSNLSIKATDACVITGPKLAGISEVTKTLASCSLHADKRCSDDNLRSCTSSPIAGSTTEGNDPAVVHKTVTERLDCSSKCSDSVFQICDLGTPPETSISDFLKTKHGARTICSVSASNVIEADKVNLTKQLNSDKANLCKPSSLDNSPRYPYQIGNIYRSLDKDIEFVAGTNVSNGVSSPKMDLIPYIKTRIAALSSNQFIFTALIQKSSDPIPLIGSRGEQYEKLIAETGGNISKQVDSIKAADYSIALRELSSVLKSNLERTFTLKNMNADQIITQVTLIKKSNQAQIVLPRSEWLQAGKTLKIAPTLEFLEGDQFKVDYQNDVD